MSKSQEDFLWGVLIGGFLGVVATLLTTPIAGTKLREEIMKGLNNNTAVNGKKKKPKTTTKKAVKK
jgi:gas vesicle protein